MEFIQGVILPDLFYGSNDKAVELLQILLNAKGYPCGSVDGQIGPKTKLAVEKVYKESGLMIQNALVTLKIWQYLINK